VEPLAYKFCGRFLLEITVAELATARAQDVETT